MNGVGHQQELVLEAGERDSGAPDREATMLKKVRAALRRVTRGGRAAPRHRAHDPREARRYRAGGDIDIAKGQTHGLPPGGSLQPGP
jgi:hypothetical protein